ncbi:hypothetical protein BCV69DRAFT_279847 [Microstroma glucosiphilum]|uniref:TFIIS N-terminal domain-containing protein n=1 Tax=Pseudomicrostroma glucosiphilum TaxID=1684307 RepID=A0A316UFC6_9BASI|nr:hypothetical protein BCV69DRAFT_279847 [Pseudomicrostroma glucosiphilum]PWN23942.1 hypothetical protein BCV69DRAFT_279847 [Pseudomicrostroma glucosiphilum]
MSLGDAFNFRGLIRPAAVDLEATTTALPGSVQARTYQDIPGLLRQSLSPPQLHQEREAANHLAPESSWPPHSSEFVQTQSTNAAPDVYIDVGPDPSLSPPDSRPPASPAPVEPGFDEAAQNSFAAVLRPSYFKSNPRQAAQTLLSLLEANATTSRAAATYQTRSMSLEDRKSLIADLRAADNNAFWGALLDDVRGRRMLASWLRSTIDYPEWGPTRLSLLRLLSAMPVLFGHLVDDETGNCLVKAVNVVVKNAPPKARDLAIELRDQWKRMVVPSAQVDQAAANQAKRAAATSSAEAPPSKKSKGTAAVVSTSGGPSGPAPGPMQTMSNLAQSSAYLTAVNHLANPPGLSAGAANKLAASTGQQRAGDLQGMAKKTVTRLDADLKPVCSNCKTVLLPGVTSTTRVKASGPHGQTIEQVCMKCKEKTRKVPAPSTTKLAGKRLAVDVDDDSDGPKKVGLARKPASMTGSSAKTTTSTAKRATGSKDMFSDLLKGPPSSKVKSAQPSSTVKQEATAPIAPGKPKKKVRWRDDNLLEVRVFESIVDIDEEVHASIEDRGLHGLESDEGSALRKAAHAYELEEELDWYEPLDVVCPDPSPVRGTESEESGRLEARERSVLSAVYVEPSDVPPSAGEPYEARASDPAHVIQDIALPEAWHAPASSSGPIDLEQLMRQIAGGSVTSAAGVPATSLESLGISSDGLQQLLMNSGGGGGVGGVNVLPMANPTNSWNAGTNYNQQGGPHAQSHYHQQAQPQMPQHPGPPPSFAHGGYQSQAPGLPPQEAGYRTAPGGRGGYAGAQGGPGGGRWGGR